MAGVSRPTSLGGLGFNLKWTMGWMHKMAGDRWQRLANLRALYLYALAPIERPEHAGVQRLVRDLNRAYRAEPALWELDSEPAGFRWLDAADAEANVLAFVRWAKDQRPALVCVCNFSPVPRQGHRVGLPSGGRWREVINSDAGAYGGSNAGNAGVVTADEVPWQGQPHSALITLPPLAVLWLAPAK